MLFINMRIILVSLQLKNVLKVLIPHFPFKLSQKRALRNLDNKKAVQSMDIPTKVVKEYGCLFSSFITSSINKYIHECTYVDTFKKAEIWPLYKKDGRTKNQFIGPLVSFRMFQKFMKDACMIKFILCHFFLSPYQSAIINVDGSIIKSSNSQKLLGVTVDSNFTFEEHVNSLSQI